MDVDLAAFGKPVDIPGKRRFQAHFIEKRWMEQMRHGANFLQGLLDQATAFVQRSEGGRTELGLLGVYVRQIDAQCGEQLPHTIVQFTGNASSFFILRLEQTI